MKTRDQRTFENQNAEHETDQRNCAAGRDRKTEIARAEDGPKDNCDRDDRKQDEERHCQSHDSALWILAHEQTKNSPAEHADQELAGHGRSNAELFKVIVPADATHQREKWTGINEN